MATDFYCSFCGRLRSQVPKLIAGPRVFICDGCVRDCISLATDGAAARSSASIRIVESAGSPSEHKRACSFCGDREPSRMTFARDQAEADMTWLICANCIGLCVQMLAEDLGGEWNERMKTWPEAAEG